MIAALVKDGLVVNVVVVDRLATLQAPAFATALAGATPIAVPAGVPCGPGWAHDPAATPPFVQPQPVELPEGNPAS